MKKRSVSVVLGKLLMAVILATVTTFAIGMQFGIPLDVKSLERNLQALERASYIDGRAVSDEVRDKALADEGYTFHSPASGSATPPVGQLKIFNLFEGALRWYPGVFGVSFLLFLSLLRPGVFAGVLVVVALSPLALILSAKVAVYVALAGLTYFSVEKIRTRVHASPDATT
jgi:hypothetical protein